MSGARKAHAVGFNHVAIEVGDIDEALSFYGQLFDFKLPGRSERLNQSWTQAVGALCRSHRSVLQSAYVGK